MNIPKIKFIPMTLAENIEVIKWAYFENNKNLDVHHYTINYFPELKEIDSTSTKVIHKKIEEFKQKVKVPIYEVSAIQNKGLDEVLKSLKELVKNTKDEVLFSEEIQESHVLYKFKKEKPFTITKENNTYIIKGATVEKLFQMTNFNTEESFFRFSSKLRKMGIDDELEKMGIQEGDTVRILDYEFEYTK